MEGGTKSLELEYMSSWGVPLDKDRVTGVERKEFGPAGHPGVVWCIQLAGVCLKVPNRLELTHEA